MKFYKNYIIKLVNFTIYGLGGKDFYIPMMETNNLNCSYFCLAKDGYAYCIQAIIPKKLYTKHWEENLNKIFSTFTIL